MRLIEPVWNAPSQVRAISTTRQGGVSGAPYDSFNLGAHVGDDLAQVLHNRQILEQQLKLPSTPCWLDQFHSTRAVQLEVDQCRTADAAVTRRPGQVVAIMSADCLPILFCNRDGSEVAGLHAGWRGLQAGVIQSCLASMQSSPQQIIAWIGPAISQEYFEVGAEVVAAFGNTVEDHERFFKPNRPDHWLCDLSGLATLILTRLGVSDVSCAPHCSYSDESLFYSYRRETNTGRMASLIWIDDPLFDA